ncbi:MAG: peptide/nickel transport system permease protein [Myxococcota bacterium]|jgi:peptide/nickel transport system permease protein
MASFLSRRIFWFVITLWLVVSASFFLAFVVPADPVRLAVGPHASPEVIERVRIELKLDQPLLIQYGHYLSGVLQGDLGFSYRTREPVTAALARALPNTAMLAVGASIFQVLVGVPIGLFAAMRRKTTADLGAMAFALLGISAPTFLTGLGLMYVFGFQLNMFPLGGQGEGLVDLVRSAVLPSLTLGIAGAAYYSRLTRGEYLDIAGKDFMRTARAKGLPERTIVLKHGMRNALIPVVTFFGIDLGTLLGGAVVTETIYAWPGIGKLAIDSVMNQDIPVMLGTVLVASFCIVLANLLVDLIYATLDPRIRLG